MSCPRVLYKTGQIWIELDCKSRNILITTTDHCTSIIHDDHEYLKLNISTNYYLWPSLFLQRRLQLFWVFGKNKFRLLRSFLWRRILWKLSVGLEFNVGWTMAFPSIRVKSINLSVATYLFWWKIEIHRPPLKMSFVPQKENEGPGNLLHWVMNEESQFVVTKRLIGMLLRTDIGCNFA